MSKKKNNFADSLYSLRDEAIMKKQNISPGKYVAAQPYSGIQVEMWDELIKLIDTEVRKLPKIESVKGWKLGDTFQLGSAGIGYKIFAFPTPTTVKGEILIPALGYADTCETPVTNIEKYTFVKKKKVKIKKGDKFEYDGKTYKCIAIGGKHKSEVRGKTKKGKTCYVPMNKVIKIKKK